MATIANYDYDTEKQRIARKRQMAEAMQLQSLQPQQGQMVTGYHALAQALQSYAGIKNAQSAQTEERELADRYKTDLVSGIDQYMKTSQGTQASPARGVPDITGQNPDGSFQSSGDLTVPGEEANPRKAMLDALASNNPVLQQLGMDGLKNMQKKPEQLSQKDLLSLSGFDPKSKVAAAMAGDMTKLAPETKEHVVGNQLVSGVPGAGYQRQYDGRDQYGNVGTVAYDGAGRPILGQQERNTGRVNFAPGGGTTVNVSTEKKGADAFAVGLGEDRAKKISTSYDSAVTAQRALDSLAEASTDMQAGIKSGAAANVSLGLAKWAKAFGMDADPAIANTEGFRANMAQQVMASVKALGAGTGISNADREFAEKAAGGDITLDDRAMQRLLSIQQASAANVIMQHKDLMGKARQSSGANAADLEVYEVPFSARMADGIDYNPQTRRFHTIGQGQPTPAKNAKKPAAPAGKVMTLDDYLKKQGY